MTTASQAQQEQPRLYNHWGCQGCDGSRPLTLGDRVVITGRGIMACDDAGNRFCGDCLADLPAGVEALAHVCSQPAPAAPASPATTAVRLDPVPKPRGQAAAPFVSATVTAWIADIDARLEAARTHGCDPRWCTAYRWDGHHVPTCRLARIACIRAGLPDTLAEMGYVDPIVLDD